MTESAVFRVAVLTVAACGSSVDAIREVRDATVDGRAPVDVRLDVLVHTDDTRGDVRSPISDAVVPGVDVRRAPPEALPSRFSCSVSGNSMTYLSAAEMCAYLNAWRSRDQELQLAVNTCPNGTAWYPLEGSADADAIAQGEAERVASGGTPRGEGLITGGGGYTVFFNDATSAPYPSDITYTSHQGMTEGRRSGEGLDAVCVFDSYLAYTRLALRAFNCRAPGAPEARHIGCGAAVDRTDGGATVWRVVKFLP